MRSSAARGVPASSAAVAGISWSKPTAPAPELTPGLKRDSCLATAASRVAGTPAVAPASSSSATKLGVCRSRSSCWARAQFAFTGRRRLACSSWPSPIQWSPTARRSRPSVISSWGLVGGELRPVRQCSQASRGWPRRQSRSICQSPLPRGCHWGCTRAGLLRGSRLRSPRPRRTAARQP